MKRKLDAWKKMALGGCLCLSLRPKYIQEELWFGALRRIFFFLMELRIFYWTPLFVFYTKIFRKKGASKKWLTRP